MISKTPVSLITGASRGIGRAAALKLAQTGHELILIARDLIALEQVQADCQALGALVSIYAVDLTDRDAVTALFRQIHTALQDKALSHLVHCAGQMQDSLLAMTRLTDMDKLMALNVGATVQLCQLASKLMLRHKTGHLLLLSSKVAEAGSAGQAVYAATKGAVSALVKSLAKELGPTGIRVNAVAPGFIETDLTAHYSEEKKQQLMAQISLRRLGQADEVAAAIGFLCSTDAGYITGHILAVDGGFSV
ncbi:MAG: SDR family oxidoreductase [Gammaproteobacteria bacterium]|nr:SDR family oxidoreductase [Gammaproteobacteria bacterium]MBU2058396.1 SDR family oxidoreductase [Gammaproteobacteria bacterium]MBU2176551.1 SDR family oxidoreductase [Gammaproteobacteria bacterium]MBU2248507.1 SDR family oxidoreductase [Gammaproteobacteria bacterium]MBU2345630.1 SDR family oxidoreductase [Gammaproteobacteria bacterium]